MSTPKIRPSDYPFAGPPTATPRRNEGGEQMSTEADTAELARLRAELERADVLYQRSCEVEHALRAEVERLTAVLYHRVCEVEPALRSEVERLTKQIKDDNRAYGCELRDPNGTIWEQAAKDQARAERAEADTRRLAALIIVWFSASYSGLAAIDAAMKEEIK